MLNYVAWWCENRRHNVLQTNINRGFFETKCGVNYPSKGWVD